MLGMAVLSVAIAIPLQKYPKGLTWLHNGIQAVVGAFTIALGSYVVLEIGSKFLLV